MTNGKRNEQLAQDIYNWCKKRNLWGDCCIYFNGKAWASWAEWHGEKGTSIDDELYEYENKNPVKCVEYANPDTITMTFEGGLYHVLNANINGWVKLEESFSKLFEKHHLYYELGNAWNLSAYEF